MSKPRPIEVASEPLLEKLSEIEERLAGIETMDAYVHQQKLSELVAEAVGSSPKRKQLLKLCEVPMTIGELQESLSLKDEEGVQYHLRPLRDRHILTRTKKDGKTAYVWSQLIARLPPALRQKVLS